jgi:predicted secreted Zn-dependent protease
MRLAALTFPLALGALCCCASAVSADTRVRVMTRTYDITGDTGAALVEAMNHNGPKQGFMTRAIAQTAYTANWNIDVSSDDGVCRLRHADGTLGITYTFPRLASATPALARRWNRFFAGVRAHEQTHGRIAIRMMRATEKSISGLEFTDNWLCSRTRREARRRIRAIYADYDVPSMPTMKRSRTLSTHASITLAGMSSTSSMPCCANAQEGWPLACRLAGTAAATRLPMHAH